MRPPGTPGPRSGHEQEHAVTILDDFDGVRFEVDDGIASITIDRPEAGNTSPASSG